MFFKINRQTRVKQIMYKILVSFAQDTLIEKETNNFSGNSLDSHQLIMFCSQRDLK